jgi:hypothetical protein
MFDGVAAYPIEMQGRKRCLASVVPLSAASLDPGTNSGWAHVAMLGTWEGHSKGTFSFTPEKFAEIMRNFSMQRNPIPWDYEHDTFDPSKVGPKPASGWVKRLELRANGTELWAYVDWTPKAADMIRNGEYRFCSPVVDFESIDRKSNQPIGAELLSVALTNNPFLDGQHPLQLTWIAASYPGAAPMAQWPPQQQHPQQAPAQTQAWPQGHMQQPGAQPQQAEPRGPAPMAAPPPPPPPPHAPPPHAPPPVADPAAAKPDGATDANAFLDAIADAAGIDKAQTLAALLDIKDQLIAQIQKTISRDGTPAEARRTMSTDKTPENVPQPTAAAPVAPAAAPTQAAPAAPTQDSLTLDELERKRDKERLAELQARLEMIEKERAQEKQAAIAQLVDEKIKDGYVRPDQRDTAIWAYSTDRARAEQIYADRLVPIGTRQTTSVAPNQAAVATNGSDDMDESQFSKGELMTIQCLMGAHKSRKDAIAVVMSRRQGLRSN